MTRIPLLTLNVAGEDDVVAARQRARLIARALGFDAQDQTRIATAVSELARNIQQHARDGRVVFELDDDAVEAAMVVQLVDRGPGIPHLQSVLDGTHVSSKGTAVGLAAARRLSDRFDIQTTPGSGTRIMMAKLLPGMRAPGPELARLAAREIEVARPGSAADELSDQNRALAAALGEMDRQRAELERLNSELDETNRGVLALYRELDDRAEDLRRASESKSRFLSMISHELRTPLTSVLNLSRLLLDRVDGDLTAEQERQVLLMRTSVQTLIEMVNDLLDLARIEAGKTNITVAPVHASEMLAGLRGVFRPVLQTSAVTLVFDDPSEPIELCTDEGKLAQVLRNFLSNAVKFTETGEIRVTVARHGHEVTFSVTDTGIGIAREDQERIFEDFTQVENARQRYVRGTGLGLPLSRKIAGLLGGSVGVESELGEGSRFWIQLPLMHPLGDPGCTPQRLDLSPSPSASPSASAEVLRG